VLDSLPRPIATLLLLSAVGCAPRATAATAAPACSEATAAAPATEPATSSTHDPDDPLASLAWLAGTWVSDDPEGPSTVEHWLAPEGGSMLGVGRTAHDGRTVAFEFLRIEAEPEGVAYLASPQGKDPPTRFAAAESGKGFIAFENPEHDFPQRIEYRREDDRLQMRISGEVDGAAKAHAWSMRRADG
jgi:hypothetical protein